jgi:hypothetical protein
MRSTEQNGSQTAKHKQNTKYVGCKQRAVMSVKLFARQTLAAHGAHAVAYYLFLYHARVGVVEVEVQSVSRNLESHEYPDTAGINFFTARNLDMKNLLLLSLSVIAMRKLQPHTSDKRQEIDSNDHSSYLSHEIPSVYLVLELGSDRQ